MRVFYALLKAVDHSSYLLIASVVIGLLGLFAPENVFVHFGVHTHDLIRIFVGLPLIVLPFIIWMKRTAGIIRRSYAFDHFLDPPRKIDLDQFDFKIPESADELAAFVELSDQDENTGSSYEAGTIDRKALYKIWREWRPDAFMALIKVGDPSISSSSVQAISIILPLTANGIRFFRNNGRARDLDAHHVAGIGEKIEGLLLDTWIVRPRNILEIGKKKRIIRENVGKHQNALYLIHMSLFWHTARHITIIFEASNEKLAKLLGERGFVKLFPRDKLNKHYYIALSRLDYIENSFASSILSDLKRFHHFKMQNKSPGDLK